ncbi:Ferric/cupric reductase transmembrane component 2 [Lachnellula cervina]|uniref:Ferric/cupric reductase transmembrane component 2 n=1 Tax=Lachnellula cervina TaxID=1316786 RepID=A0A7D8ZB03_9HELO|nr:Ferric/cupric reductase transmembrane component 2 [Lachnellula cervina]
MSSWPYHFVDLNDQQKHQRRILLDRYGVYAQLSALVPVAVILLLRLGTWVLSERKRQHEYSAVPSSPGLKRERLSSSGALLRSYRRLEWWLESDVGGGWGVRGRWIAGLAWGAWLLFLSVHRTGDDYLHITKRFGEVAVSQFPMHYILSMKSAYSPLALVLNSSHEELNPWHRLSGRIIYSILALHASWYLNFFIQAGLLAKRLKSLDVLIGIAAFIGLTIISTTSLAFVRRWSYRVFFVMHLTIGVTILPLLFFHASHLRFYIMEALAIFVFDIVCRKLDTTTGYATITSVPHTKLVKLKIPIPASKIKRFHAAPGQHVYLSIPPESAPPTTTTPSIHDLLFNPFTVADVGAKDITLVLRTLNGPTTKAIESLGHLTKARPPINIEGPLGSSRRFTNLAQKYDRILLFAGGVGATFTLPVYHHLQKQLESEGRSPDHLTCIWSMRSAAESSWAIEPEASEKIDDDANVKIFLTRTREDRIQEPIPADGSIELNDLTREEEPVKATGGRDRPDIGKIVDSVFKAGHEESVAVLVCGPVEMAREVRKELGKWVSKGRNIWFHDESFGW